MKGGNHKKVNLPKCNNLKRVTKSPISKKRDNDYATTYKYEIERIKRILIFHPIPYTLNDIFNSESDSLFRKADGMIKRPPNCFIFFRQIAINLIKHTSMSDDDRKFFDNLDQPLLSKIFGALWKSFSLAEKSSYKALCSEVVELHKSLHPDWKYAPKRSKASFKVVKFDSHAQGQYQESQYEEPQCEEPQYQEPQYQEPQYQEPQYQEPQYQEPQYQTQYYEDCPVENQSPISNVTPTEFTQDELMQTVFIQDGLMQFEFAQGGVNQTPIEPCITNPDSFLFGEQVIYPTYEQFTSEDFFLHRIVNTIFPTYEQFYF
ncbi:1880_t:CDS:1 [Ambispora leptoticha]|uniref:1880_t:CDS:1 n=1 Tax=Ambispora leptoticha TaxID=144679 RepID=A0A9N8W401_9GLOM|nr:1880_t:CDS:1 [Ambispora leptoticha]